MPKKNPQPEAPKRKRGRPDGTGFHPTEEQRELVTIMAGLGIPEDQMVAAVKNKATGKGISPVTLRQHFRKELDEGFVQANTKVAASLYKNATTPTDVYPGGIPTSQIFWLKCRMRWQQNPERNPPPPPAQPDNINVIETAKRLAFMITRGDVEMAKAKQPEPAPGKKKIKLSA